MEKWATRPIFQQLSTQSGVCDVNEQGSTTNSSAANHQSQNWQRHLIRVPTILLPCIRKIIHCVSSLSGRKMANSPTVKKRNAIKSAAGPLARSGAFLA